MFNPPTPQIEAAQLAFVRAVHDEWALVTAGTKDSWNTMTIGWGEAGTLWSTPTITVYVHPRRYTNRFLLAHDYFTVQLFGPEHKHDLGVLGSRSGRDGDKIALTSLTPMPIEHGMTFEEAKTTIVCRKLYTHQIDLTQIPAEVLDHFAAHDAKGGLYAEGAHLAYTAEVIGVG
jgi:flavin reductase (DIM6/NTAB) family NADH-FMN oxidoreductase RutF